MSDAPPEGLIFTPSSDKLNPAAVVWVKVADTFPCSACRTRGGWLPQIDQSDCPMCYGDDPYGQSSYCGECEFCCGC